MKPSKKTKIKRQTHELFFVQPACCGSEWISSSCGFIWWRPISFSRSLQSLLVEDFVPHILQGCGLTEALPSCHLQSQDRQSSRSPQQETIEETSLLLTLSLPHVSLTSTCWLGFVTWSQLSCRRNWQCDLSPPVPSNRKRKSKRPLSRYKSDSQKKVRSETWQCSNRAWRK